jgi:hypothetical protein
MAQARMLHKKISISQQVNKLSVNARLLFTWLIAHADDEGRLRGEANYIRALVVPMTNWSDDDVEKYLVGIADAGLIYRWTENDECFIEFIKWFDYQQLRKDRFKNSSYPSYPHKEVVKLPTFVQPDDNQSATQSNVIQPNTNKRELSEVERSSTSEMEDTDSYKRWKMAPSDPDAFVAMDEGEQLAYESWSELEPNNKFNFKLTYLKALYIHHLPPQLFREFVNNIKQDPNIKKPGAVFNKKVQEYIQSRKEEEPIKFT